MQLSLILVLKNCRYFCMESPFCEGCAALGLCCLLQPEQPQNLLTTLHSSGLAVGHLEEEEYLGMG